VEYRIVTVKVGVFIVIRPGTVRVVISSIGISNRGADPLTCCLGCRIDGLSGRGLYQSSGLEGVSCVTWPGICYQRRSSSTLISAGDLYAVTLAVTFVFVPYPFGRNGDPSSFKSYVGGCLSVEATPMVDLT